MKKEKIKLPQTLEKYRNLISEWNKVYMGKHYYYVVLKDGYAFGYSFIDSELRRKAVFATLSEALSAFRNVKKVA